MSAYDLIKSGDFSNPYDADLVEALLSQAKSLATAIAPVFDTVTGLPAANMNFTSGEILQSTTTVNGTTYNSTNTAQAGTMILEYYRLSDLTGDESFREHVRSIHNNCRKVMLANTKVNRPRKLKSIWLTPARLQPSLV